MPGVQGVGDIVHVWCPARGPGGDAGRKARLVTMSRGIRSASVHLVRVAVVILQGKHAEVGVYS